jgi:hypothetical protein
MSCPAHMLGVTFAMCFSVAGVVILSGVRHRFFLRAGCARRRTQSKDLSSISL